MWEDDSIGTPGSKLMRGVPISDTLSDAINRFIEDKGCKKAEIFDSALISLWRIFNGYTETNTSAGPTTENKVRIILEDNSMPKDKTKHPPGHKQQIICVHFKGDQTFEWVKLMEKLRMFHGVESFVRKSVTWYLRDRGYLPETHKHPQNKQD